MDMEHGLLGKEEKKILLQIARNAVESAAKGERLETIDLEHLPEKCRRNGASFVTLTRFTELRGCIGAIEAYQPLAIDVQVHAAGAAVNDYRFQKVSPSEVDTIEIEISCLSPKQPIMYQDSEDLIAQLVPGIDGIVMVSGTQRATFLPQVWEKLPDPKEFLSHLSMKMGYRPDAWAIMNFEIYRYRVEKFGEKEA